MTFGKKTFSIFYPPEVQNFSALLQNQNIGGEETFSKNNSTANLHLVLIFKKLLFFQLRTYFRSLSTLLACYGNFAIIQRHTLMKEVVCA